MLEFRTVMNKNQVFHTVLNMLVWDIPNVVSGMMELDNLAWDIPNVALDKNKLVLYILVVVWYMLELGMWELDSLAWDILVLDNNLLDNGNRLMYAHRQPLQTFQCM